METTSLHEPKKKVQISAKLKEIDILVTECSTPNISSPLPPKTSQFLLPEDQNNRSEVTALTGVKSKKQIFDPFAAKMKSSSKDTFSIN